jgi:CRISPR-associated endonuclease/helicase Cas3
VSDSTAKERGFQRVVQELLLREKSVVLVAPTGLGKTRAVCGDLQEEFRKIIYAVPLRALGGGIKAQIADFVRNGKHLSPVLHHGDSDESHLFSEEIVVTTYDQVVCGVPGLPLSLPLKAGHAVAGALLMSRLVLDEVHLAWTISPAALSILLAIIEFRLRLGLQTVVLTATLPEAVAQQLAENIKGLEVRIVGRGDLAQDERLKDRNEKRTVKVSRLSLRNKRSKGGEDKKQLDWSSVDCLLLNTRGKRIYFANTVERLQETYDRLLATGLNREQVTVLHNRMPRKWRDDAEQLVEHRFGKYSLDGDWLLLTNQVAEAGLDISAPLVISDPAPVDTLVQRAGRCARWFDKGPIAGDFYIVEPPKAQLAEIAPPYRPALVSAALNAPPSKLDWESELKWVNESWGENPKKAREAVERALNETAFALNLFDRAAQNHDPGAVSEVFREILTVEVAVDESCSKDALQERVGAREWPQTSSVSLGQARKLIRDSSGKAKTIRYEDGDLEVAPAGRLDPSDIVIVPPSTAYLHKVKGLCFGDGTGKASDGEVVLASQWELDESRGTAISEEGGRRQTLLEHLSAVTGGVRARLTEDGLYRQTLIKMLTALEPQKDAGALADAVAQIASVAAAFHDLGKADIDWQRRVREIDPACGEDLIGRTARTKHRVGRPHTPPAFKATVRACEMLLGGLDSAGHLVGAIALAAARHHSSLLNPALTGWDYPYHFEPHAKAEALVRAMLAAVDAPPSAVEYAREILAAAKVTPRTEEVPLLLPNDELFPIYALVGRAILMADREDASGKPLESWRPESR